MRPCLALGALGVAGIAFAAFAGPAAADVLTPALGEPLTEVSHAVDITIDDGVAVYKVRRVFANAGERADEAGLEIDLPPGAAATGLRIRARDRWYDGELMEAGAAAAKYQELTGIGAHQAKDPALLQWVWADKLYLQVFPVLPGATSTVEYTLTVPTRYQGGQVFLSYPRLGTPDASAADNDGNAAPPVASAGLATPILTIHPAWGDATTRILVDGVRVTPDAPVVLSTARAAEWLERVSADPGASYVASEIVVPRVAATRSTFATASLRIDIDHTFKADLRIQLLTPGDELVDVFEGDGGGENDVKDTFQVALPAGTRGAGSWRSASDAGLAAIVVAPPPIDVAVARLGKVVASKTHAFSRLEIDVAPELRPLPTRAQIVFVVDASHSQGPEGIEAQLALVRAYLSHVPDAEAEVVLYRRRATRLFGGFVGAAEIGARLAAAAKAGELVPANGSALEDGARVAVAALAGRKGPRRIVITTDELLRSSFHNALAQHALERAPADTIVHIVVPALDGSDEITLVRDDGGSLAALASDHHGILARVTGVDPRRHKALADAALGLVRPIRIDHFAIAGLDLDLGGEPAPEALAEGDSVRAVIPLSRADAADKVVLTGKIWGDDYRAVARVDQAFSRAAAAFVFSEDDHQDLSNDEMMKIAIMGKAVSPVTSYLAAEPGVRPSTIGIPGEARGGIGRGSVGYGAGGGTIGIWRSPPDLLALLAAGVTACVATHQPAAGWSVGLSVETTRDEVVDVATTSTLPIAACLVEAAWAVRLDGTFDLEREQFALELH